MCIDMSPREVTILMLQACMFEFKYHLRAMANRGYYCFKPPILMKIKLKNEIKKKN